MVIPWELLLCPLLAPVKTGSILRAPQLDFWESVNWTALSTVIEH